jgi:hypothetical protein
MAVRVILAKYIQKINNDDNKGPDEGRERWENRLFILRIALLIWDFVRDYFNIRL